MSCAKSTVSILGILSLVVGIAIAVKMAMTMGYTPSITAPSATTPTEPQAIPSVSSSEIPKPSDSSCPEGMVHVRGEYCFDVKYECYRSTETQGPKWEDFCFAFRPGSGRCGNAPKTIAVRLLLAGMKPSATNEAEPSSPIARAVIGKKTGDDAIGCRISVVRGSRDGKAKPGASVELSCPPILPVDFCIDRYEYPNKAGALPAHYSSWYEAKTACEQNGKRLCYEHEWTTACEGPAIKPYPYGHRRDNAACNISRCVARCDQPNGNVLEANGLCRTFDITEGRLALRPLCPTPADWMTEGDYSVSRVRVDAELNRLDRATGTPNVTFRNASGSRTRCVSDYGVFDLTGNVDEWTQCFDHCKKFPSNLKGGHFLANVRNRCQPVTTLHGPHFRMHSIGFRCCSDTAE